MDLPWSSDKPVFGSGHMIHEPIHVTPNRRRFAIDSDQGIANSHAVIADSVQVIADSVQVTAHSDQVTADSNDSISGSDAFRCRSGQAIARRAIETCR